MGKIVDVVNFIKYYISLWLVICNILRSAGGIKGGRGKVRDSLRMVRK